MRLLVPISKKEVTPKSTTYHIGSRTRGEVSNETISLEESKYYQFTYDDGTTWFSDSATIHELFPNMLQENRDGNFTIPLYLESDSENRGLVGKIILTIIKVFTKPAAGLAVKTIALKLEASHLKAKNGLCQIDRKFNLIDYTPQNANEKQPYLLFIHGTNSDTLAAFDGLKNTDTFSRMVNDYGSRILAFNHRTLTDSPLKNAAELAEALPDGAILHIISHSRGGLVGDILSRYASNNGNPNKGFLPEHLDYLRKEDREDDLKQIKLLDSIFASKDITVEKFIRVASPSAGTILASERIDHILNVLFNMLGDNVNVIADLTHELIGAVLEQKSNIDVLPGIEAMNPTSPFIKILNAKNEAAAIDGKSLMVISGNGKLSLSFHGLLVVLGKLFYLKRNDLVVNTDSMYLGIKRIHEIQYYFDEASYVDHVHYFKNRTTQEAILNAVKTPAGARIPGFKSVAQLDVPASDRGLDGGELFPQKSLPTGKKPILIMLPGIMGSNIYDGKEHRLWLNYKRIIFGGLKRMAEIDDDEAEALSIIETSYRKLYQQLSYTYDVILFPFDWRQPMEVNADKLNKKVTELMSYGKPIKVVGHSMGGVLFRDFIAYHPNTWKELNARADFKVVFLGAPLKGSHRILAVLFGKDSLINKLSMLDITHTTKELINIFSQLPGILSLLPFTDSGVENYADENVWKEMRKAFGDQSWPIPNKKNSKGKTALEAFKTYRDKINLLSETIDYTNMFYIAGQDKATACGYKIVNGKLIFEYTKEGDHSVTWKSGIPQALHDKKQVYYTDITHGDLANAPKLFNGIEEILSKGSTLKISQVKPVFRDADLRFEVQEHFDFDLTESGLVNTIMGTGSSNLEESAPNRIPLHVTVSHGDLSYATFPIIAGHFKNDAILFAEKAINANMNNKLQHTHDITTYPGNIGDSYPFRKNTSYFEGALIVGLGEPGKLTSYTLSKTVELGVLKLLLEMQEVRNPPQSIGVSSLIIGCGYGGLSVNSSTTAIIEGIISANTTFINQHGAKACTVSQLEFIEQDKTSAINCLFTCRNLEIDALEGTTIYMENKTLRTLFGAKEKLRIENANDWWNRITVKSAENSESLIFNATTGDAREEESELVSDARSIDVFIQEISTQNSWSEHIAQTLFQLMIPNNFKDQLKRKGSIAWVLDKPSASYPWELLQDNSVKSKPLCIDSGMIRQLITRDQNNDNNKVMNNNVLIIADPDLNGMENINQLSGALREGEAVHNLINSLSAYEVKSLKQSQATDILSTLMTGAFKILHIAAHGSYDPGNKNRTGVIIGNNNYLTVAKINQMPNIPELVFVNCCHLGKIDGVDDKLYQERYRLAANVGTQFIEMGVKAVIVAGWQVDDADAETFAVTFYQNMLNDESFGTAVKRARSKVYNNGRSSSNTWGAYQCYGDPFYKLDNRYARKAQKKKEYLVEEEACIDIENLYNSLDVRGTTIEATLEQLKIITDARDRAGFKKTDFTEIEALLYYELGLYKQADQLFMKLKRIEDAKFSVEALEKFCNNKAYLIFETYLFDKKKNSVAAIEGLDNVLDYLNYLNQINATSERMCLQASTFKRKGFVIPKTPKTKAAKIAAYEESVALYKTANNKNPIPYSLNNYVIFEIILDMHRPVKMRKATNDLKLEWLNKIEENIKVLKSTDINMDYWEKADYTYSLLARLFLEPKSGSMPKYWNELTDAYKETRGKYGSIGKKQAELYNLYLILDALEITTGKNSHQDVLIKEITMLIKLLK